VFADGVVVGRSFNLSFTMRSGTTRATARTLAESFRLGLALTHPCAQADGPPGRATIASYPHRPRDRIETRLAQNAVNWCEVRYCMTTFLLLVDLLVLAIFFLMAVAGKRAARRN
jgi:hypothetical protein